MKGMRKLTKIVRINFFSTLKINLGLQLFKEYFFQEKWQNLNKSSGLCGFFTCPVPIPSYHPQICYNFENKQPTLTVETSNLVATGKAEWVKATWKPFPRELSLFPSSGCFLEDSTHKAYLTRSSPNMNSLSPRDVCWKQ